MKIHRHFRLWLVLCVGIFIPLILLYNSTCSKPFHEERIPVSSRNFPSYEILSEENEILLLPPVFPSVNKSMMRIIDNKTKIGVMSTFYFQIGNLSEPKTPGDYWMLFQPMVTQTERDVMLYTFEIFIRACEQANLTYFLYGGTLLGAYRHHGLIPWDDDIDVMINAKDKGRVKKSLSQFSHFGLHSPAHKQWKFYLKDLASLGHRPYRWPYVDIFFFVDNSNYIWDESRQYRHEFNFSKSIVFPLQFRPFENALLPVPCNMASFLSTNYLKNVCITTNYVHKLESDRPEYIKRKVHCKHLHNLFPFVFRTENGDGTIIEKVKVGTFEVKTVVMPQFCKTSPFVT